MTGKHLAKILALAIAGLTLSVAAMAGRKQDRKATDVSGWCTSVARVLLAMP